MFDYIKIKSFEDSIKNKIKKKDWENIFSEFNL